MTNSTPIAIVREIYTISITFQEKPSEERRSEMKARGYKFENGNWYKSDPKSHFADDATVAKLIAA